MFCWEGYLELEKGMSPRRCHGRRSVWLDEGVWIENEKRSHEDWD
jgi:hypothetical protein